MFVTLPFEGFSGSESEWRRRKQYVHCESIWGLRAADSVAVLELAADHLP